MTRSFFPESRMQHDIPHAIDLQTIAVGEGKIHVIEQPENLPFSCKRQFLIESGKSAHRGGAHAHEKLWQVFVCCRGQFKITLEGISGTHDFVLENPSRAVVVPPGYWGDYEMAANSVVSVLASDIYSEADYIRDYDGFKSYLAGKAQETDDAMIPFVALDRENAFFKQAFLSSMEAAIDDNDWILGDAVREFENEFARYCGTQYAIGCGNGLDALSLALKARGIGHGDEVIVPANSYIATALAASNIGAVPVFVDCLAQSAEPDTVQIEAAITQKTKAIIPVHLYGVPVDMERIMAIADAHDLFVLEDAAHAHGALYNNRKIGSIGHAAAFSFYPSKNLGALGDGGCVVTNDAGLAHKVRLIANYGSGEKHRHVLQGVNSRLDTVQAAFLIHKLAHLDDWNVHRRKLAALYYENLAGIKEISMLSVPAGKTAVWHVFPIFLESGEKRDALKEYLAEKGVVTNMHYPLAIHQSEAYGTGQSLPNSERNCRTELSLPLSSFLAEEEVLKVCKLIAGYF